MEMRTKLVGVHIAHGEACPLIAEYRSATKPEDYLHRSSKVKIEDTHRENRFNWMGIHTIIHLVLANAAMPTFPFALRDTTFIRSVGGPEGCANV